MTPQDDNFSGPTLDPKWTFFPTSPGGNGSYSFATNPGNITLAVPTDANLSSPYDLGNAISLRQSQVAPKFLVELGLTTSGILVNGQESGVYIAKSADPTTFVMLTKKMVGGVSQIHAFYSNGGVLGGEAFAAFPSDINIVLRIVRYGGVFAFFYKLESDVDFTPMGFTAPDAFGTTTFGLVAHASAGTAFNMLANYFRAHTLADIQVNADVLLRIGNTKITNADLLLQIRDYPGVRNFQVHQHFEAPINTLTWEDGVLLSPTLLSPNGTPYTLFVADDGAIGTAPGSTPVVDLVYIMDVQSKVWQLTVDDDGALVITPRPNIDPVGTVLILLTSPDLTQHYVTISYLGAFPDYTDPALVTVPTDLNSTGVIIVRKEGTFPETPTDGTVLYTGPSLLTFDDGPIYSHARQFYSVFATYTP